MTNRWPTILLILSPGYPPQSAYLVKDLFIYYNLMEKGFRYVIKKKGIAIRTVCKRLRSYTIKDRPPSKKYSYHKH